MSSAVPSIADRHSRTFSPDAQTASSPTPSEDSTMTTATARSEPAVPTQPPVVKIKSSKRKRNVSFARKTSSAAASSLSPVEDDTRSNRSASRTRLPYTPSTHLLRSDLSESRASLMSTRYRYYGRLEPRAESRFVMPDHVVPEQFFLVLPFPEFMKEGGQNSVITVFSIWNTMMGTSLLSMPWALQQAGLFFGVFLMLLMAAIAFYTAYRVVQSPKGLPLGPGDAPEFADVCRYFWGRPGELIATFFSVIVLVGGVIVYWVLMSNFLYYTGAVIHVGFEQDHELRDLDGFWHSKSLRRSKFSGDLDLDAAQPNSSSLIILVNKTTICDVTCVNDNADFNNMLFAQRDDLYSKLWGLRTTVPIFLALLAYPLLNFKSPTFFTKFNVFGTVSVIYLLIFVSVKAFECGFHINLADIVSMNYAAPFSWHFPSLTGTLALSYFIHNAIMAILRNQKNPENNVRDLALGYALSAFTYIYIALAFYVAFPLEKSCIADNLLNNFGTGDALSAVARLFLLFQMLCVLPLLMYIIRAQLSFTILGRVYPGLKWVMLLNAAIIVICILFAIFVPTVGNIIRFTGSISGLIYIFTLPCLVHMSRLKMDGRLTWWQLVIHGVIIFLGLANLVGQFVIL